MFVSKLDEFKKLDTDDVNVVYRDACRVYALFIRHGAPFEINLSATTRDELDKEFGPSVGPLKKITSLQPSIHLLKLEDQTEVFGSPPQGRRLDFYVTVFGKAHHEIMAMLRVDSFLRFCHSDLFLQLGNI